MQKIIVFVIAVIVTGSGVVCAEESEIISAERPGFSSSPIALPPSRLQIEGGYQYTRESGSVDVDDHTLPLALIRVGLAERVELQLGWAGYSRTDVNGQDTDGINDAGVGIKWQLNDENATVPLALFAGVSLPVGDDRYSSDEYDPTLGVFWSHDAGLSWFGTVLVSESDDNTSVGNAVGVGLPIRNDTSGYVEYFGVFTDGTGPEHYLNGGLAHLSRNDLQLDLHVGVGLNSRAADMYMGIGFAYRF